MVNAAVITFVSLVTFTLDGLAATVVAGACTPGMLLLSLQAGIMMFSALWYDHGCRRRYDPHVGALHGAGRKLSALFLAVVCLCFLLCLVSGMASDTASGFYAAELSLPAVRSALSLCGDCIPVTALLSPIGTVAPSGYDSMVPPAAA
ncbi:MAG TPA: hypothetical protein VN520_23140 [Streptomyces sp.]|uniref:hypothetical protein n=1 Tax=Streptomyces sp. TaxID=1931 RepID=UPI002B96D16C|nr:hypothetical protein [Streptomyces sp.]HWU09240.1 hypothetical protein [Streptomyces sp.]